MIQRYNQEYYYKQGYIASRYEYVVAFGSTTDWRKLAYQKGYNEGMVRIRAEAKVYGYGEDVSAYQCSILKLMIK